MDFAQLVLGQIPEAVYFALFLIFTKNLKEKRVLFTIIMVLEYILLGNVIEYDVWLQISYTILTFITLKVLYKEKAQITDLVTFTIASIILIITSALCFLVLPRNPYIVTISNRVMIFSIIFLFKNKLIKLEEIYHKYWNRHDNPKMIKSVTFRSAFIVIFNLMFYVINLGMLYMVLLRK